MIPIKTNIIPYEISKYIKPLKSCFSKPQFEHFCTYTLGLIESKRKTVNSISKDVGYKNQSSLNRFITRNKWDKEEPRKRILRMIKPLLKFPVLVIDDTHAHKTGKHMQGADYHYDNLHKKHCFGYKIVTSSYASKNISYPFRFEVYQNSNKLAPNTVFLTKNSIACNIIDEACNYKKPIYVTIDCWYFNKIVIGKIKENKLNYVSELKSNRKITIGRSKRKKEVREQLLHTKMKEHFVKGKIYKAYSELAYIKGIGKVKVVFSKQKTEEGWDKVRYFVTNMVWLNTNQILSCYLVRASIEGLHKDDKQNLGLETFQFRKYAGVVTHLTCVLLAHLILLLARVKHKLGRTIGILCNKVHKKAEGLCLRVVWSLRKNNISMNEILYNYGLN